MGLPQHDMITVGQRLSVVLGWKMALFLSPAFPIGFSQPLIPLTMTFIFSVLHKDKNSHLLSAQVMKNTDLINSIKQENVFDALHRCLGYLAMANLPCWHCAVCYLMNEEYSSCQACQSPVVALNELKIYW